ncbi:MAG: hypothetical protein LQ337_004066 [Flavoplaca oasis]|nr:MAG: hypothetical protein LQ337_004066 [Flavoplaca oasis]
MDNFLVNWTRKTVMAGAPMIGTIVCRPTEDWAQCFIRFAYGHQTKTAAPMDCVSLKSTSCKTPSKAVIKPTSPEFWYGLQAIFSIFTYIKTLTAALLSVTGNPDTLQKVYTSTFYGNNGAEAPNPVDLVLAALVGLKDDSVQDAQFYVYILSNPYPGNFTTTAARTPSDEDIYEALVTSLEARLKRIMGSWTEFQSVLGDGEPWVSGVQTPASQYVKEWTDISPVAGGLLDAIGSSGVTTS